MKEKNLKTVVIFSAIFLILGLGAGYFIGNHSGSGQKFSPSGYAFNGFNQIDNQTKVSILNFFDSNPSQNSVDSYCKDNPEYCMYYCREINSISGFCSQIRNYQRGAAK